MNSITKKWLRGSLLTTLLVLLLAEGLFLFQSYNTYYGGVRQAVNSRFVSISGQLKMYTGDEKATQSQRRSQALRRMVEQFDEKDKFEFTLLDAGGQVLASSTGRAGELSSLEDFQQAMASPEGRGEAIYRSAAGERVLAITILTPYQAEDIAALRLVTSLTLVDDLDQPGRGGGGAGVQPVVGSVLHPLHRHPAASGGTGGSRDRPGQPGRPPAGSGAGR